MIIPSMPPPTPEGSKPHQPWSKSGCTSCGSEQTETLDGVNGRRCADCAPTFDPSHAVELMRDGFPDAAGACTRTELDGAA